MANQAQGVPRCCPVVVRAGHDQHFNQPGGHVDARDTLAFCEFSSQLSSECGMAQQRWDDAIGYAWSLSALALALGVGSMVVIERPLEDGTWPVHHAAVESENTSADEAFVRRATTPRKKARGSAEKKSDHSTMTAVMLVPLKARFSTAFMAFQSCCCADSRRSTHRRNEWFRWRVRRSEVVQGTSWRRSEANPLLRARGRVSS